MHIPRLPAIAPLLGALVLPSGALAEDDAGEVLDEGPVRWEQLAFPSPIVGLPPDIAQYVQGYASYFTGSEGEGFVSTAEAGILLSSRLGLLLTVPFQVGFDGQPTGFDDTFFLVQYLTAGSLRLDNMLSIGVATILPTGHGALTVGDWYVGPFFSAAQRWWKRLTLELNVTALIPVVKGESARQIQAAGFVAVLISSIGSAVPLHLQVEANSFTFLGGTSGLPPGAERSPFEALFLAPEVSVGPFATPLSPGITIIGGVFVNVTGSPTRELTYTVTAVFELPNRYGY